MDAELVNIAGKQSDHPTQQSDATKTKPAPEPTPDDVDKDHGSDQHKGHVHHHAHMAADFRQRFWIPLILTLPILFLSPMLQKWMGLRDSIHFPGDIYVLFGFSSAVVWYGSWPFLREMFNELENRKPGTIILITVATATAYLYSASVVFGLTGKMFFRALATLVDIMLLGHWIEMKSLMGASKTLEELAKLMSSGTHKLMPRGSVKDVPLGERAACIVEGKSQRLAGWQRVT